MRLIYAIRSLALVAGLFLCVQSAAAQTPFRVTDFAALEQRIARAKDTTLVVNFWATWCKPCVAEMPDFEKLNQAYAARKLKVVFVSVDFPSEFETRLRPFLDARKLTSEVVALDQSNGNDWINKVNKDWSGAIPCTVVYDRAGKQVGFHEDSFTFEELEAFVKPWL